KEYGASRKCYVLSIDERLDGREVEISDALRESYGCGPVLISLTHGRLAYFESETEFGAPQRYLISRVF
ncbi:MAG: hypothetical protein IJC18_01670, partial [Clostridia bacterium]|nr:hypothetical protein [Clostridia bacterium]